MEANRDDNKVMTLGVLGLGEGRSIISAALQSKDWELGMICDLNEELCKERCEEFGFDTGLTVIEKNLIYNMEFQVMTRSAGVMTGTYLFTIDNYHPHRNEPDFYFAEFRITSYNVCYTKLLRRKGYQR